MKKAQIKSYPTNIDLFVGDRCYSINIDFQDSSYFEDDKEAYEWVDETLRVLRLDIDNMDEIREKIRSAIDRYVA